MDKLEILRNVLYPTVIEENKMDVDENEIDEKEDKNDNVNDAQMETVNENVTLYCTCRKSYVEGEEMMPCDDCSEYYHRI